MTTTVPSAPRPRATLLIALTMLMSLSACGGSRIVSTAAPRPATTSTLDTPAGLVRLGDDVRKQGDLRGALLLYQAASSRDGHDEAVLLRIGSTSLALGEPLRAEGAFRAAIALDSHDVDAGFGLGIALLGVHQVNDALPILASLGRNASDPRLVRAYGVALDMAGRAAEAQEVYRRGLKLTPTDADLHGDLALSLAASGDNDAALSESDLAVSAIVPDPIQQANKVLILALIGQEDEARRFGDNALGANRTDAVLARAAQVRETPDPAARASALGLLMTIR